MIPGIEGFFSKGEGTGGTIKETPEDFVVEEISPEGETYERGKEIDFRGGSGDYTHFILEKKDWDTHRAVQETSRRVRVSKKRIGFAGTKDKRAVTVQRMSVWKVEPERLANVRISDIIIRPLCKSENEVKLGDLYGNRFTAAITGIELGQEECKKRVLEIWGELREGLPNFYGEQRFGASRAITHEIGKHIVEGNMEQAVRDYTYRVYPEEKGQIREAREHLRDTQDFKKALNEYPKRYRYERLLIEHLIKYPNDWIGAMRRLPKFLQLMFIHAYQSYIFNRILSERAKSIGLKPVKGDILDDGVPTGVLFGYESQLAEGKAGEIEQKIIEEEELRPDSLKIRSYPELSSRGLRRPLLVKVSDFEILEAGMGRLVLRFSLPKSAYATNFLREFTKNC